MNSLNNPLPPVWHAFITSWEALKLAKKVLKPPKARISPQCNAEIGFYRQDMVSHTVFDDSNAHHSLENAITEAENLFIIALWATFERFLREYLQSKISVLQMHVAPLDLGTVVYDHCHKEMEYWKPDDILDFLQKSILKSGGMGHLGGQAKQIYDYRNYLAHGRNRQQLNITLPTVKVKPDRAYVVLNEIVDVLLVN